MPTDHPRFGCKACGALDVHIPQWSREDMVITCGGCGATLGTIGELRDLLHAALEDDEDQPASSCVIPGQGKSAGM